MTDSQAADVRKGQGDVKLSREEFARRLGERFYDPAFDPRPRGYRPHDRDGLDRLRRVPQESSQA